MSENAHATRWGSLLRVIPNKRELLARALGGLGILGLIERTILARRPRLLVLTYHRIAEREGDRFYEPVISASPESFTLQMNWLRDRVPVLSLEELAESIESNAPWSGLRALVTFDDGYRDNFDTAVPILRERGIPATFFLPTAFFEAPRLTWWDHVAYVIKQTNALRLRLERGTRRAVEIELESAARSEAVRIIIAAFLEGSVFDPQSFLAELDDRAGVVVDEQALARELFMGWDEARKILEVPSSGFSIGSHTHSHRRLADLDNAAQQCELEESKRILEQRLGRDISALAYPYGWAGTYTTRTKELAGTAGYQLGFSAREGVNRVDALDRFEIQRLNVGGGDTAPLLRARAALHAAFGRSVL